MPTSVWLDPPAPRPGLSREALVRSAVALLDADGLDRLSMRRVAADLGVTAGALYWYVTTKDELLELALDDVLGEALAPPAKGAWRDVLAAHASRLRRVLLRHPWALPLMGRLPNIGPNALALADAALDVAARAGFAAPSAVVAALHDQVAGAVLAETGLRHARATPPDADRLARYLTAAAERHPSVAAAIGEGTERDAAERAEERFVFSLDCLLDGLEARRRRG
jgi:AcrR family transcriptional regulator